MRIKQRTWFNKQGIHPYHHSTGVLDQLKAIWNVYLRKTALNIYGLFPLAYGKHNYKHCQINLYSAD